MARYSSVTDLQGTQYSMIDETFHKEAERYIDAMYLYPHGLDPDEHWNTFTIPPLLKRISQTKAIELYAQQSSNEDGDKWFMRANFATQQLRSMERRVDKPFLCQTTSENYTAPDKAGHTGRLHRC